MHIFRVSVYRNMSNNLTNTMLGPVGVRGMQCLDREKFSNTFTVPVLYVGENGLSKVIHSCKKYFLKLENFKPVQSAETTSVDKNRKCVHLNPQNVKQWTDIADSDRFVLEQNGILENNFHLKNVEFSYANWSSDQIFKAVLPENVETVSGFSQIGHIVHLNLREHLFDYRMLIGQVLVDKIKTCRTVINKCNIIDNTYRNFSMELLAGDEDFMVTVKENRCIFEFDFSKVYWNPRLGKEHERILGLLKPGDILFDVFCGVGPFAIPAAKKKCKIYANDLNPDSFKWLNHNAKLNKINPSMFKTFNDDGKDFICNTFKNYLIDYCNGKEELMEDSKIQITMNLPAIAVEFLKYFNGLISNKSYYDNFNCETIVHVYCFAVGDDPKSVSIQMVNRHIQHDITSNIIEVFNVRHVAPKKDMMRISFSLSKDILFNIDKSEQQNNEPPNKKLCMENAL